VILGATMLVNLKESWNSFPSATDDMAEMSICTCITPLKFVCSGSLLKSPVNAVVMVSAVVDSVVSSRYVCHMQVNLQYQHSGRMIGDTCMRG
jgi:hypothetical protein